MALFLRKASFIHWLKFFFGGILYLFCDRCIFGKHFMEVSGKCFVIAVIKVCLITVYEPIHTSCFPTSEIGVTLFEKVEYVAVLLVLFGHFPVSLGARFTAILLFVGFDVWTTATSVSGWRQLLPSTFVRLRRS